MAHPDDRYQTLPCAMLTICVCMFHVITRFEAILTCRVEWSFWTSSNDACGATCDRQNKFKLEFADTAINLLKVMICELFCLHLQVLSSCLPAPLFCCLFCSCLMLLKCSIATAYVSDIFKFACYYPDFACAVQQGYTQYRPHFMAQHCLDSPGSQTCQDDCINHGRYCAMDSIPESLQSKYKGRHVCHDCPSRS